MERDSRSLLEAALREHVATGCPGVILEISAPSLGFTFSGAEGFFARDNSRRLRTDDVFRAASVTKAVTAATAVRLASHHRWNLDDPITPLLPPKAIEHLSQLKGLKSIDELTIRRLLNHSSGLPDYFFDEGFQAQVKAKPDRVWHSEELIEAASATGQLLFPPGTDFAYGDTSYALVGIAIEQLLGCPLAEAYRSLIFAPLEMQATYLEGHEASRSGEISHHYDGSRDLWDANLSFDWAGGGLVTTAGDLIEFMHGLFGNVLFDERWLYQLTSWRNETRWRPHSSARYLRYGLGLGTNIAFGEELVGVTGVWGAFAYYWPNGNAAIAGTLNLVGADRPALIDAAIVALKRLPSARKFQSSGSSVKLPNCHSVRFIESTLD
ncbi:beta-lactamase family protein [Pleurocapsales cyanobacterium LEGE 06147]|nr:beta-lactamase family protein [Pleurocapsales cyanobacterium LEGE 06147]